MNKSNTIAPYLNQERANTDTSLNFERGKTDESFFDLRKKTEKRTDAQIKINRIEADLERAKKRNDCDIETPASHTVEETRVEFDKNLKNERSNVDAAIMSERIQKEEVLNKFLYKERGQTDESLEFERKQTDSFVLNSSDLLKNEVILHNATKAELTTRDELIALVSHDLRSPIGAVFSCAEMLLEDDSYSNMSSEMRYWIEFIKRNAATSLQLIGDILDMERIVEGKLVLSYKQENIAELLRFSVEQQVHLSSSKGIFLRISPLSTSGNVPCDRNRILQVLSNLISNALKFTPKDGIISVRSEELNDFFEISVCDTGTGISEADQPNIFGRYIQVDNKDHRGLGLGLHICKALVESHGGKIWVESTAGKGSTFFLTLPKQRPYQN